MEWNYNYDYISHHGILGQKWGIRRFQNPDGTLTTAGKKRYGAENVESISSAKGIRKRLNDLEEASARNSVEIYKKQLELIVLQKSADRALKNGKTKVAEKESERVKKTLLKMSDVYEYNKQGREETRKLLEKTSDNGYLVKKMPYSRLIYNWSGEGYYVDGIVYDVKEPKEKKI